MRHAFNGKKSGAKIGACKKAKNVVDFKNV